MRIKKIFYISIGISSLLLLRFQLGPILAEKSIDTLPEVTIEWEKTFETSIYEGGATPGASLINTSDGGFLLVGSILQESSGNTDLKVIKTDSTGDQEWTKTFGGPQGDGGDTNVAVQTNDGGYAISGYTYSFGAGSGDYWLLKLNASGTLEWNKTYGGPDFEASYSMIETADEGFGLLGNTESNNIDMWFVKTNSTGDQEWNKSFGGFHFRF